MICNCGCEGCAAEIQTLREALGLNIAAARSNALATKLYLTPHQTRLVLWMYDHPQYFLTPFMADQINPPQHDLRGTATLLKVQISYIRIRLDKDGVTNSPGQGYRLSAWGRKQIDEVLS